MKIFELVNNKVKFSPQALELKPFKALWLRDKSEDKARANAEMAFVYYFSDYKSDFANETNNEIRAKEIMKIVDGMKIPPDNLVYEACDFYTERQKTISIELLYAARVAASKIKQFYLDVDLTVTDKSGKPIWDITKLQNSLTNLSKTIEGLENLEDRVKREMEEASGMRGNRKKAMFEDGQLASG